MNTMRTFLVIVKNIMMAIILGGILGNLVCILEFLRPIADDYAPFLLDNDYLPCIIMITVISYMAFYFVFMRQRKSIYAVVFIPSEYYLGALSVDFWGRIFISDASTKEISFAGIGVIMLLIPSLFLCTLLIFLRWVLIKRGKLLVFEKIVQGYCVELKKLLFVCGRKDKYYKKQIRALADAYYQTKEKEIVVYMIHQKQFIQVYGEITEDEMLIQIDEMPFMPRIYLQKEMCGTIVYADEINVIKISFEGMFENLCDIIIEEFKYEEEISMK